jgi:phosphoglycerate kinase
MKFIDGIDIKNKKLLCRFDYNVPMDEHLNIADDRRIRASLPRLIMRWDEGAKVIIISIWEGRRGMWRQA